MSTECISTIKKIAYDESSMQWNIARKFQDSRTKVSKLVLVDLAVCPFLFFIILLSIWHEQNYPKLDSVSAIFDLLNNVNPSLLMTSAILWLTYHFSDIFLLLAMSTGNLRFCRLHVITIAPILEISTIVYFILVMWSVFNPIAKGNMSEFVIATGSVITLIAIFFNEYLIGLSQYLLRFNKYIMTLKYWPTENV